MKTYTVYILECNDQSYYTGVTNDLQRRIHEHNSGNDPKAYTYFRRPVKLVFEEHFHDPKTAIAFEKQIKGWRRDKKKALINREWKKLPELSENYAKKRLSTRLGELDE